MNILQICANYPPVASGYGIYAQNLSLGLSKYGVNTTVLTFNPNNINPDTIEDKLLVKRTNAFFIDSIEYPIYYPSILYTINKIIKNYDIDVINSHTRFFTSTFFTAIYKKLDRNVTFVHTEHGAGPLVHNNKYVSSISKYYDLTFGRWILKSADIPIAIGPSSKNFMQELGCKNNIEIIPNSLDCTEFQRSVKIDKKEKNEKVVITYIGRLVESKGIADLINVFADIEKKYDVILWVVGNGPDELKLRQLVQSLKIENIEFMGFRKDIASILSKTSIFVNPSHYDSVPTTILEAGCLGVKVVASNVGDVKYIVGHDYPNLYKTGSLTELKENLVNLIEASDFKDDNLRQRVLKNFNWEINSKKYLDIVLNANNSENS